MNKFALLVALLAFVIPIGLVVAINFDSIAGADAGGSKLSGKLIYFYSPS